MNRSLRSLLGILLCVFLLGPTVALACGPFTVGAVFVFTVHPAYPLEKFARGEIGVIQPSYARSYLVVAYRHLAGISFTEQEQQMLNQLWKERLDYGWQIDYEEWTKTWLAARQKVPGLTQPEKIDVYRNREKPNQYETFLNCQKDAFDAAINTLNARIAKYGVDAPAMKNWVAAQDQVFSNCREGQQIPASETVGLDALGQADREYQIAAASFYSTNFDEAVQRFDSIANDNDSPWRSTAPYLSARSLIRKASLAAPENKTDALTQAEQRLIKILADTRLSTSHAASSRLLDLVRLRLRPAERLHDLAGKLITPNNSSLKQDLWDYTILLDGFIETTDSDKAKFAAEARTDDLTDWVVVIQSDSSDAMEHAIERWRATRSMPWLIASLTRLESSDKRAPELIAEALKVEPDSPAFASARFHAVRMLIETGKADEARRLLDQLLPGNDAGLDESARNLFLSQRLNVATNLSEFLASAPRLPAALSWDDDGREIPTEDSEISPETKVMQVRKYFDVDASTAFNIHLPLSVLKEAAKSSALPVHLRHDVAQAAWLRAVLLEDFTTADELTPVLKTLIPSLTSSLDKFALAQRPEAKRFAAIFMWLKTPGMEPVVDQGLGRQGVLTAQDTYRDNWWCSAAYPSIATEPEDADSLPSFTADKKYEPPFLSASQRAAATREYSIISRFGAAPNFLARQVIQWANTNPTDPRVPEALHLAVNTTRFGCTDKDTGRWSKSAFDLLHRRYGNTTWARKTKYWFKD